MPELVPRKLWYSNITKTNLNNLLNKYKLMNKYNIDISNNNNKILDRDYEQWLVGFIDGEGSFRMTLRDNKRYTFDLNIHLHVDDIKVLEKLKYVWNSNNNIYIPKSTETKIDNTCSISFGSKDIILETIIPLLDKYSLITNKKNDYELWKKAFLLNLDKTISWEEKESMLIDIKNKLNKYEESYSPSSAFIKKHLNINWFIGFLEAEGSFLIRQQKDLLMVQITQHENNETLLNEIVLFLNNLTPDSECTIDIPKKVPAKLYKDKNKLRIMFSSLDYVYWVFIPNILNHNLETKKTLWFTLWSILVILKKHGLINNTDVRKYIDDVKINFNKNSSNGKILKTSDLPKFNKIISLLEIEPLYNKDLTHDKNARLNKSNIKSKL